MGGPLHCAGCSPRQAAWSPAPGGNGLLIDSGYITIFPREPINLALPVKTGFETTAGPGPTCCRPRSLDGALCSWGAPPPTLPDLGSPALSPASGQFAEL